MAEGFPGGHHGAVHSWIETARITRMDSRQRMAQLKHLTTHAPPSGLEMGFSHCCHGIQRFL